MSKSKLLDEVLADAKEFQRLTLAKAKADLDEALTPQLKAMLEAKLAEEAEEEEEAKEPVKEGEEEEEESVKGEAKAEEEEEGMEETLDIDAALAEIESGKLAEKSEEAEEEEDEEEAKEKEAETDEEAPEAEDDDDSEIDEDYINSILAEVEEGGEEEDEAKMKEGEEEEEESMDEAAGDEKSLMDVIKTLSKEQLEKLKKALHDISPAKVKADMAAGKGVAVLPSNIREEEEEEDEAKLAEVKQQLQEMNLLAAKLMYQNKLILSENFSDEQKARIIVAFDKAKTVNEAKLIFETLNPKVSKKAPAKSITESLGFVKKEATAPSTKSKTSYDVNDPFIQKLQQRAGIIK